MSNSDNQSKLVYKNFSGMDGRPDGDSFITEAWNIDYEDGCIRRRKGKQKIFSAAAAYQKPTQIVYKVIGSDPVNVTAALTDGSSSTTLVNPFGVPNSFIYVGVPYEPHGVRLTLTATNGAAATLTVAAQTATNITGTTTNLTISDGTFSGGATLSQTGNVTWNPSAVTWEVGLNNLDMVFGLFGPGAMMQMFNLDLYWVKISASTGISCTISEIRVTPTTTASYSPLNELSGLTEFHSRTGERFLVGVQDSPSRYNDNSFANRGEVKLYRYDLNTNEIIPIVIPNSYRIKQNWTTKVGFTAFNGWLLGTTSAGYIWRYDGSVAAPLEALPGMDYQNNVIGANGYLSSPPRGTQLDIYHNQLMVTGNRDSPLTFWRSLPDNDIITIPEDAPVGGPNVWPLTGIFNIPAKEGDFIQTASVINDRYCILTRNQIWIFDETSLRQSNGELGCVSAASVQRISDFLYFLSDDGIFVTDGVNSECISDRVKNFIDKYVNMVAAPFCAVSGHNKRDNEYWLWLPIRGETIASVALIYNYRTKGWRIAGKHYPFARLAFRDSPDINSNWRTSASCMSKMQDGTFGLISCDNLGNLYLENEGIDDSDSDFNFPAYAILREPSFNEDYDTFREWYVLARMDGCPIECWALGDNDTWDQMYGYRFAGVTPTSEAVAKVARLENAVDANISPMMSGATWGTATLSARFKKIKFSFGRSQTKMTPVLHLPGGQFAGSFFYNVNITPSQGKIKEIQFGVKPKPGGR